MMSATRINYTFTLRNKHLRSSDLEGEIMNMLMNNRHVSFKSINLSSTSSLFLWNFLSTFPVFPQYWHVFFFWFFQLDVGSSILPLVFWSRHSSLCIGVSNRPLSLWFTFLFPLRKWAWCYPLIFPSSNNMCWSIINKSSKDSKV